MQVQDGLEASFVSEAEMVFTTLSSTGRKVCSAFPSPFPNVNATPAVPVGLCRWAPKAQSRVLGSLSPLPVPQAPVSLLAC